MKEKTDRNKGGKRKSAPVVKQLRKNADKQDYCATFLKSGGLKSRQCVYISKEVHGIVSKIVNTVADKQVSIGGYIDTVLMRHFKENREEINRMYRCKRDNLI